MNTLEYRVVAKRRDSTLGVAAAHGAQVDLDTSLSGGEARLNPVELLLAALAACMIKGVERAAPMLNFRFESVEVELHAVRQNSPPMLTSIDYVMTVGTDELDRRLELLHTNVRKYGTISATLANAVALSGTVRRRAV
jgi:uncharacterized OsmC-like protein